MTVYMILKEETVYIWSKSKKNVPTNTKKKIVMYTQSELWPVALLQFKFPIFLLFCLMQLHFLILYLYLSIKFILFD